MNIQQQLEALQKVSFAKYLSESNAICLLRDSKTLALNLGETLFREGDSGRSMYIILAGELKVTKQDTIIAIRGPYDFIGEMAIINDKPRAASIVSISESTLLEISRELYETYLARNPEIVRDILRIMSDRTRIDLDVIDWGYRELLKSEERYRNIVETVSDIIIQVDTEGLITFVNPACRILGYDPKEMIGEMFEDFLDPHPARPELKRILTRRTDSRLTSNIEIKLKTNAHSNVSKEIESVTFLVDAHGVWDVSNKKVLSKDCSKNFIGTLLVGKDITTRKRLENKLKVYSKELERSNADLQELAYTASHDLQEPLRKIIFCIDRLKLKLPELKEDTQKHMEITQTAALRMQKLIENLLQLSKVSAREKSLEPVSLESVVEEALQNLDATLSRTQGTVIVASLPTLEADPSQMLQLFQNIIGNALKFHRDETPPVVNIRSSFDPESRNWEISVIDNGIGFNAKHAPTIFLPFKRLHSSSDYEGTGMGLAICAKIAHRHGGDISAISEIGKGATFTITLPRSQRRDDQVIHPQAKDATPPTEN